MSRFDLAPYVVVGLWLSPLVVAAIALAWGALKDRREARDIFGADGPAQRALLSLVRDEARR